MGSTMRIAVDAMGGDNAPHEVVAGAVASCTDPGHEVLLVGLPEALEPVLEGLSAPRERIHVVPAEDVVEMGESPVAALKRRKTSLAVAVRLVRDGEAEAVVSAGNSGAFMGYATLRLDTVEGVERPAIAVCIPSLDRERVVLDVGANASCQPNHLVQFAQMGSVYARDVLGIGNPAVGLLSIGEEASKGSSLTKAAHKLLAEAGEGLNFTGNVEGNDALNGPVDVIVCDGFVGNVLLKTAEGAATAVMRGMREAFASSLKAKLGALLARDALLKFRERFDYATYGGALLLGVKGICVVCHGRSDARAIRGAISVAERAVERGVVDHIADSCRLPAQGAPEPSAAAAPG